MVLARFAAEIEPIPQRFDNLAGVDAGSNVADHGSGFGHIPMVCRLNLTILLLNFTSNVFSPHPDDRLQLSFGPGLGDQRSYGLGYADSIYSFVEPVALIDGKVKRFRPKQTDPIVLPWSHSKPKWVGLHGRYFALLLAPEFIQVSKEGFKLDQVSVKLERYKTTELPFNHLPVLSIQLPVHSIAPGDSIQWKFVIFSGPKSIQVLMETVRSI